jgi:hypothetical protein
MHGILQIANMRTLRNHDINLLTLYLAFQTAVPVALSCMMNNAFYGIWNPE